MSPRVLLHLVALPAMAGSILLLLSANLTATAKPASASCGFPVGSSPHLARSQSLAAPEEESSTAAAPAEFPSVDFSAAESDAAVALFGCDCPPCINALRQLRSHSLSQLALTNTEGHCWSSLQRRSSEAEVQQVLQNLEAGAASR